MGNRASRIWMDGFGLSIAQGTGIATYARNLADTLQRAGFETGLLYGRPMPWGGDAQAREIAFFDAKARMRPWWRHAVEQGLPQRAHPVGGQGVVDRALHAGDARRAFSPAVVPPGHALWNANEMHPRALWRFGISRWFGKGRLMPVRVAGGPPPALMHWTHLHPIRLAGALNVTTLHDAIPLRMPWVALDDKRGWQACAEAVARASAHIVTVSEHARRDLISLLGIPEEKITNTWQAVPPADHGFDHRMSRARIATGYGLEDKGYHLCLGSVDPRKNLTRLLDAYMASGITRPLILVGGKNTAAPPELRLLTEAEGTRTGDGRVRHLGYLPRDDVAMLVRHARTLCFPTLYEGFGLPAVEAMLEGTAVLTSNVSSLPEVVGDAALMVDPTDTRALAEALLALDGDDALRARYEAAGPARAAFFSPERHAARLAAVYARLGIAWPQGAPGGAP
jgi:glycosyltransferase involved in cell wall biosynthesis